MNPNFPPSGGAMGVAGAEYDSTVPKPEGTPALPSPPQMGSDPAAGPGHRGAELSFNFNAH